MKKLTAGLAATAIAALGIVAVPTAAHAAATVNVTIIDADTDLPIPNATVVIRTADLTGVSAQPADANGEFSTNLSGDGYYISVRAEGYGTEFWPGVGDWADAEVVDTTSGIVDLTFVLDDEGIITGTVYDAADAPIPNALIDYRYTDGTFAGTVSSDSNGDYEIDGLGAASYIVRADSNEEDNLSGEFYDDADTFADADPVAVTSGATVPDIDFHLDEGGAVEGLLTNTNGSPIPLWFYAEHGGNTVLSWDSADPLSGQFRIDKLYSAEWLVYPDAKDFWVPQSATLAVTETTVTEHDFVLEPALLDESAFVNEPQTPPISGPTTVEAGATYEWTVDAQGEIGDTYAFIYSDPTFLAAATPNGDEVTFSLTIPADTDLGTHALLFTGHNETYEYLYEEIWFEIEVVAAALPATGAEPGALIGIAALLLLAGAGVVHLHRREVAPV